MALPDALNLAWEKREYHLIDDILEYHLNGRHTEYIESPPQGYESS